MRRIGILITIIITLLTVGRDARAQKPTEVSEDYAKAGLIYKFALFVEWPTSAFAAAESPMVIGVLGDDSFAAALGGIVEGKTIYKRKLVVTKLKWSKDPKDFKDCTMLYIAAPEAAHGDELIHMLRGTPTLSISDFAGFARHGGITNLYLEDSKIRFEVNVDAAKESGLNISSQLLSVARTVHTDPGWR
jgi:hypothetical protein